MDKKLQIVLFQLMESHSKLAEAEYKRNPSYNTEHFSYIAEEELVKYLQEYEPFVLTKYLKTREV